MSTQNQTTEQLMAEMLKQNAETNKLIAMAIAQQVQKANEPSWISHQWEGVKTFHTEHTALAIAIDLAAIVGIVAIGTTVYGAYTASGDVDVDLQAADRLRAVG